MCLTVGFYRDLKTAKNVRALLAKEDIIVYKELNAIKVKGKILYISPYQNFEYKRDILYRMNRFGRSYSLFCSNSVSLKIEAGFHAYTEKQHGRYKAIIPKGSKYFVSLYGSEIVSNQLIIKRKCV